MARSTLEPEARRSAEERRDEVIAAAIREFAEHGYHAASTTAIARRAGISQPYIYALFPNKQDLFLACHAHVIDRIRSAFTEAARGTSDPDEALARMGSAYYALLADRDELLVQLQGHAAAGDPGIREEVRRCFTHLFRHVERITGAPREDVVRFFAKGMLLNVAAALELPDEYCGKQGG
jgi:AcrR family transcriptional regulator